MATRATLALPVADLVTSLAFYIDRLGFKLAAHIPEADVAEVVDSDGDLFLLAGPRASTIAAYLDDHQRILQPGDTLSFYESDLTARRARLLDLDVSVSAIVDTPWGDRTLTVCDPDGFALTFIAPVQRTPEELLALYVEAPDLLASALANLTEADLDLALTPDSWTIRQIVHHLADGGTIFLRGIRVALAEPGHSYAPAWPGSNEPYVGTVQARQPIAPSVALFRSMRAYIHQLIIATPDPWDRAVHDPSGGVWTVQRFINLEVRHALEHLAEIREIRATHSQ